MLEPNKQRIEHMLTISFEKGNDTNDEENKKCLCVCSSSMSFVNAYRMAQEKSMKHFFSSFSFSLFFSTYFDELSPNYFVMRKRILKYMSEILGAAFCYICSFSFFSFFLQLRVIIWSKQNRHIGENRPNFWRPENFTVFETIMFNRSIAVWMNLITMFSVFSFQFNSVIFFSISILRFLTLILLKSMLNWFEFIAAFLYSVDFERLFMFLFLL